MSPLSVHLLPSGHFRPRRRLNNPVSLDPHLPARPKDVRFLGSPIDLVVFDGLAEGRVRRIVFLEVKTGSCGLTSRERSVRDVVQAREVEWAELRVTRQVASGAA